MDMPLGFSAPIHSHSQACEKSRKNDSSFLKKVADGRKKPDEPALEWQE
jgi:hypothetical protein